MNEWMDRWMNEWTYRCIFFFRLIIGSDRGLVIINTVLNQMMHALGTITSILCKSLLCI